MLDTGEIIKQLRESKGWTQEQLGEKVGVKKSAVAKWENGRVENLKRSMIETLSKIFNVSPALIMGWEDYPSNIITTIKTMNHSVPVYGRIPAGTPFEAIQERLEDVPIPDKIARKKDLFGLKIVGDSMNKVIPDGAIAIFQKCCELNQGEIGAIMVNGDDATVKHFYKLKDGCLLEPESFNENHEPLIITEKTGPEVRIIGRFIWYCMDLNDKL